jgi:hypothetical protein
VGLIAFPLWHIICRSGRGRPFHYLYRRCFTRIRADCRKEVLSLWIQQTEDAKFWLKARSYEQDADALAWTAGKEFAIVARLCR